MFPKVSGFRKSLRRWFDARGPRVRFIVFKLVVMAGRPIDTGILQRLAVELERAGALDLAVQCWDLIHRLTPYASGSLIDHLPAAVASGEMARVRWLAGQARREVGFPPGHTVWLAGMLACDGHYGEAGWTLASFAGSPEEAQRVVAQFPSIVLDRTLKDLDGLSSELREMGSGRGEGATTLLRLARLCFTFRKMELAARLYRQAGDHPETSPQDSIAKLYAIARAHPRGIAGALRDGDLAWLAEQVPADPDALAMIANVALAAGDRAFAASAMERAIRAKYAGLERIQVVVDDLRAMIEVVDGLRMRASAALPPELLEEPPRDPKEGVPKVFICGFGWSGSGAVYDDIRGAEGFSEFEGAGNAPLLNADSDTETTFIQSEAGLGDTWAIARATGRLGWHRLWDLVCLHVAGMPGVGYNDYKSCAAAANNVRRHGPLYTRPFRRFFEGYAVLLDAPARGGFHELVEETIESLCRMLLEQEGGRAVLFNNAVFGRRAELLRLCRSSRAAVVFRDPLDVYADRRRQDKNHWRTPRQLADLYGRGLGQYIRYRTGKVGQALGNIREVPFERYVQDPAFRSQVREWLLSGVVGVPGRSYLDPAASSRNIGLHRILLDAKGREEMHSITGTYRDMQRLAGRAWSGGASPAPGDAGASAQAGPPPASRPG